MAKKTGALRNKAYKPNSSLKRLAEIKDFSGGINLTSGSNSKFNNQVDVLTNFEITSGGEIAKRPGTKILYDVPSFEPDNGGQLYGFIDCSTELSENSKIDLRTRIFWLKGGTIYNGEGKPQSYYSYKELFSDETNFSKTGEYIEQGPGEPDYKILAEQTSTNSNICGNQQIENGIMYWKVGNKILMYPIIGSWVVLDTGIKINNLNGSPEYNSKDEDIDGKLWIEVPKFVVSSNDLDVYGVNTLSSNPNDRVKEFINPSESFLDAFSFNIKGTEKENFKPYSLPLTKTETTLNVDTRTYDKWEWEDMARDKSKNYGTLTKFLLNNTNYSPSISFYDGWSIYLNDPDADEKGEDYWKKKFKSTSTTGWNLLQRYDWISFEDINGGTIKTWKPKEINTNTKVRGNIEVYRQYNLTDASFVDIIDNEEEELKKLTLTREEFSSWTGWKSGSSIDSLDCIMEGSYGEGYAINTLSSTYINLGETNASNQFGSQMTVYTEPFVALLKKTITRNPNFFKSTTYGDLSDWTFTLHPSNLASWNMSYWFFLSTTDIRLAPFILDGAASRGMGSDSYIKPSYFTNTKRNIIFPDLEFEGKTVNWVKENDGSVKKTYKLYFDDVTSFKNFIGPEYDTIEKDNDIEPTIKIKGWDGSTDFKVWEEAQKVFRNLILAIKDKGEDKIKRFDRVGFTITINNKDDVLNSLNQENIIEPIIELNASASLYWELENDNIDVKDTRPKLLDIFLNNDNPELGTPLTAKASISGLDYAEVFASNIFYSWNILKASEIGKRLYENHNYSLDINEWNDGTGVASDKTLLEKDFIMVDSEPHTIFAFKSLIAPPTEAKKNDDYDWSIWPNLKDEVERAYGKDGSEQVSNQEFFEWSLQESSLDVIPTFKEDLFELDNHLIGEDLTDFDFMIFNGLMLLYKEDKIWISTPYNYGYFPKSYIKVLSSEGGQEGRKIQKIKYFQNSLIVFTNQDIHRLAGTNPNSTGTNAIKITKINNNYGAIIKDAIVNMNNKVVFISNQGIFGLYSIAASIDDSWNLKRLDEDIYGLIDYSKYKDAKAILYKDSIIFTFNNEGKSQWLIYKEGAKNNNWSIWESSNLDVINIFNSNGELFYMRKNAPEILKLGYTRKAHDNYIGETGPENKSLQVPGYQDGYKEGVNIGTNIESTLLTKKYDLDYPLHYKKLKQVQIISENLTAPTKFNVDVNVDGESILETKIYELIEKNNKLEWDIKDSEKSIGKIFGKTSTNNFFYYNGSVFKAAPYTFKNTFKPSNSKGLTIQVKLTHNEDSDFQVSNLGFLYKLKKAK